MENPKEQNEEKKAFFKNTLIAGGFIAFGLLMPMSVFNNNESFLANITGISLGIGIGWITPSYFNYRKSKQV